ncbi:Protein of unknown function [Granulicella rosea]|uniref:DUF2393 domain-containing protein n=1 Tax=Granulicella rosea TaxID=474952 RepID=A0A239JUT5_9BACT|nr:DUF2393 family protein [Granulicella rosea]SNT09555.1 Protein of unknown function [Granulicella rosea]
MSEPKLFSKRVPEREESSKAPWLIAGLVVLLAIGGLLLAGRHKDSGPVNAVRPLDPYAASLAISKVAMSESTNLSGGKLTFIDGVVKNTGAKTVTGATVQVLFANDENLPPEVETVQLLLIRSHEPYIDTQTLAATPLKPGDEREFRLIFEGIGANWNQQLPEIHVTHVE